MTNSMYYDSWVTQLANMMVVPSTDSNFQTFLPGCIDYAEQRMYRDLEPVVQNVTNSTNTISSGVRNFTLPTVTGTFLGIDQVNVITPANTVSSAGTKIPLTYTTRDFIDAVYPSNTTWTAVPEYWSRIDNTTLVFGPTPDATYYVEVYGQQRPTPLSSANSSTYLTQTYPDAWMAATMVYAAGYMRDFGSQADNPAMSASWEATYKGLITTALSEENRKLFRGDAWTSQNPSPVAQPPRV